MKKIFKIIVAILLTVVVLIGAVLVLLTVVSRGDEETGESTVYKMAEDFSPNSNVRVVDIAMLGAHDAFAENINNNSPIDGPENEDLRNGFIARSLAGSLFNAQKALPYEMLTYGVRYFDVRVTHLDGEWYTKHCYVGDKLEKYILSILMYLDENKGEIVIFDIQHIYYDNSNADEFITYLERVKYKNKSLFDYTNYDSASTDIGSLTYGGVTVNGTTNGVIIFLQEYKENEFSNGKIYERNDKVRSTYYETAMAVSDTINGISEEHKYISEHQDEKEKLRVMQAMPAIKVGIRGLSLNLNNKATKDNIVYADNADFSEWLKSMPVFMVNNSITTANDFQRTVTAKISAYNKAL